MFRRYGRQAIAVWAGAMIVRLPLLPIVPLALRRAAMENGLPIDETVTILEVLAFVAGALQLLIGIVYEHRRGWRTDAFRRSTSAPTGSRADLPSRARGSNW